MAQTMETMKKHGTQPARGHRSRDPCSGVRTYGDRIRKPDADRRHHIGAVSDIGYAVLGFADWNFVQGWDGIQWVGFQNFRQAAGG